VQRDRSFRINKMNFACVNSFTINLRRIITLYNYEIFRLFQVIMYAVKCNFIQM